jgi:hypothetical protein
MAWVWTAALVWVALALLLALLTGRFLRRSDQRETRPDAPADDRSAADSRSETAPPVPLRPRAAHRNGRSRLPSTVARAVVAPGCFHRTTPGPGPDLGEQRPDSGNTAPRTPAEPRNRSPLHRHR